jgi:AraC-like DNA-binding protein/mannose-6-phosphate isomerase-like protein (cupin superfamily)
MSKKSKFIPVNSMTDPISRGISIDKISINKSDFIKAQQYEDATHSHRDEGHTFHIIEKGTVNIEIDFLKYEIKAPSVVYMHPNQVHRILDFTDMAVCTLAINNENLNPEYLEFLEEISPTKPLTLIKENNQIIADLFSQSFNFSIIKNNKLYYPLLKDSCNTLVAYLISYFLNQNKSEANSSRFEIIAKAFKQLLEKNYTSHKRPSEYANMLNISTSYLNECIKNNTGFSVSQTIQDRIVLEAKRLLYHSDKSVKEIATDLGFDDYPYFSRLFSKVTGMTAIVFRNKNHE